jgi:glycosyltransferase involved in cell wall biosynthesis
MKSRNNILMIGYTNYETDPRVIREAEAAIQAGFDVDFLALRRKNDPPHEVVRGVTVIHLNQSRYRGSKHASYLIEYAKFFFRCFVKSTLLHLRRRYSVIHVNNMPDFLVFSTILAKLMGAKILLDIHDPMPDTFASKFKSGNGGFFYKLLLWQERLSASYADRVLTVHEPVKEGILVKHGLRRDAIDVISNFADEQLFQFREQPPINGKIRLIFHGTILERYGLRKLMLALSKIRNRDKVFVTIIGEGDFSSRLAEMIRSLRLQDFVVFDNKSYPVTDIPGRIANCHLGLVPLEISSITNYALPLKLIEYISMGIPVLTVRSAAISYYFGELDCLFYDPASVESLAAAIDKVADHPEILMEYHERAKRLRDKFAWNKERDKYAGLLRELSSDVKSAAPAPAMPKPEEHEYGIRRS